MLRLKWNMTLQIDLNYGVSGEVQSVAKFNCDATFEIPLLRYIGSLIAAIYLKFGCGVTFQV